MLGNGPIDAALMALISDPQLAAARAEAEATLRENDWANLGRYQTDNATLVATGRQPDLVFIGDSITEMWLASDPDFFGPDRITRGISGQTSSQILLRLQPDALALTPRAVHILCGTNDIAGNTGPTTPYRYQCNVRAMTALARAQGVRIYLGAILPAKRFTWRPEVNPVTWVQELNRWLRERANECGVTFVDYHSALVDENGGLNSEFTRDGVHPNRRGYAAMRQVLEPLLS